MKNHTDKSSFAVLARRSGVPLTGADIDMLYEGYVLFERVISELDRPTATNVNPALDFTIQRPLSWP